MFKVLPSYSKAIARIHPVNLINADSGSPKSNTFSYSFTQYPISHYKRSRKIHPYCFKHRHSSVNSRGHGGQYICCWKIYAWKINKMPKFYTTFARKYVSQVWEIPSPPSKNPKSCHKQRRPQTMTMTATAMKTWKTNANCTVKLIQHCG